MSAPPEVLQNDILEEMVNTVGVGVAMYDDEGRFLYVNDAYAEMLGTDQRTLVGVQVWDVNPPFDADKFDDYWNSFDEGETRIAETVHAFRGVRRHVSAVTTAISVDGTEYHIGTIRDITDRKERENQLEQLHTVTRDLMEADSRGEIASVTTQTAETILDYDICVVRFLDGNRLRPAAFTDSTIERMGKRPMYTLDSSASPVQAYCRGESVIVDDFSTASGDRKTGEACSGVFIPLGEHGVLGIAATVENAFDQSDVYLASILASNTETALDRLANERDLERQNERLEAFYDVISHDIPNHLNVATTRLELARTEADSDHYDPIEAAHDRIEAVLSDMRALVEQGTTVEETEFVDLGAIAQSCWENCRPEAGAATLTVRTEVTIEAGKSQLKQLLENLFWNAVDHAGDTVVVTVGRLDGGFYIEDDGPGIPPDERAAVLSPGYSTADDHAGFGLAIVREIARAHDWDIDLTTGSNGGARFEFTGVTLEEP